MSRAFFGWDIGGAHLKIAKLSSSGEILAVRQIACPLWRGIDELSRACALLDFPLDQSDAVHAVTMTGELCDIFPDRAAGVREIVARLLRHTGAAAEVRIFGGYAGWLDPEAARGPQAIAVASANWLALAAFIAELVGDGVLIDIGSTTTDIIPIAGGEIKCRGADDATRLTYEELVYTGVVRTPVASICQAVPFRGHRQLVAAEVFATMGDVYRLLEIILPHHDLMPSADGQAKDLVGSGRRLARMLGRDLVEDDCSEMIAVARYIAFKQRVKIEDALALVLSDAHQRPPANILVGAGVGRFIVEAIAAVRGATYYGFDTLVGVQPDLADAAAIAAPAVAAAKLAWMTE